MQDLILKFWHYNFLKKTIMWQRILNFTVVLVWNRMFYHFGKFCILIKINLEVSTSSIQEPRSRYATICLVNGHHKIRDWAWRVKYKTTLSNNSGGSNGSIMGPAIRFRLSYTFRTFISFVTIATNHIIFFSFC